MLIQSGAVASSFTDDMSVSYAGTDLVLEKAVAISNSANPLFKRGCPASDNCYRDCDRIAAYIWGYGNSGYATAYSHWLAMVRAGQAHKDSRSVPVGSLLFYGTGSSAGHVAIYLGGGRVLSNDIWDSKTGRVGGMYVVPATDIEKLWNARYLGWSPPIFAGTKL